MQQSQLERAITIAQRDQLHPIPCTRRDTGEALWLVQSRSQTSTYYLLTKTDGRIHCQCPAANYGQMCAHAAAVHLLLQQKVASAPTSHSPSRARPSTAYSEEELKHQHEARQRERALPWTDDKPFSIWKS